MAGPALQYWATHSSNPLLSLETKEALKVFPDIRKCHLILNLRGKEEKTEETLSIPGLFPDLPPGTC
jgi:hypothetical protein